MAPFALCLPCGMFASVKALAELADDSYWPIAADIASCIRL